MPLQKILGLIKTAVAGFLILFAAATAHAGYVPITLTPATVGQSYNVSLISAAQASPGYAHLTNFPLPVSLLGGTLPAGLTLNSATAYLTGTPTAAGSYLDADSRSFMFSFGGLYLIYEMMVNEAVGPSREDTQASLQNTLAGLRAAYALQNLSMASGLTHDCSLFDARGICVSAGGRRQQASHQDMNTNSGLLIAALKFSEQWRAGAWVEQASAADAGQGVRLHNGSPMFGFFGVWNPPQQAWEVRLSAGYGDSDLSVTRGVVGSSEAGTGRTRMTTQGASAVVSYRLPVDAHWTVSPYAGIRYTRLKANGYAEESSDSVTVPLAYQALAQQSTTALAGVRIHGQVAPRVQAFGSLGVEQDLQNRGGAYVATGIDGLSAEQLASTVRKTRPVASAGLSCDVATGQRLSLSALYRADAFRSMSGIAAMATYAVGF